MANGEIIPVDLDATSFLLSPGQSMTILSVPIDDVHTLHGTVTIGALMLSGTVMHSWRYLCQSTNAATVQILLAELHQGLSLPAVTFDVVAATFRVSAQVPASAPSAVRWTCVLQGHLVEQAVT
jgi:hypothetical protein